MAAVRVASMSGRAGARPWRPSGRCRAPRPTHPSRGAEVLAEALSTARGRAAARRSRGRSSTTGSSATTRRSSSSGPPWIQSSSGAGDSADAPSRQHQPGRTRLPSAAVASTSSSRPGTSTWPGARSRTGSWSTASGSRAPASPGSRSGRRGRTSHRCHGQRTARCSDHRSRRERLRRCRRAPGRPDGGRVVRRRHKSRSPIGREHPVVGQRSASAPSSRPAPVARSISHSVCRGGSS